MSSEDTIQNALGNTRYGPGSKTNLILCRMVECNFQGFQELQFWKWNTQHLIIQDVRCLYQTDDALVGSSIDFVTQKPCSNWPKEMKNINLIVMDEHVQQMFHSSIFDGLWFRLLRVTIMGCKANFRWIIQPKLMSYSLNNIIISMMLWPWGMEKKHMGVRYPFN